jgi:hypothetical protein
MQLPGGPFDETDKVDSADCQSGMVWCEDKDLSFHRDQRASRPPIAAPGGLTDCGAPTTPQCSIVCALTNGRTIATVLKEVLTQAR